jgi:hypothetical protein
LPEPVDDEARAFQAKSVDAILGEIYRLMVIARSSYSAANEDDPRYAMVVAKLFFRLGYLCQALEFFGVQFHDKVRSDTMFGLATRGNRSIEQRRAAARARVAAEVTQKSGTRTTALEQARRLRAERPDISQEDVARALKTSLGNLVPKESGLIKWVQAWERAGDLSRPPRRL